MRLGARVLKAVSDINNFEYANQFIHSQLSQDTLYIQLINVEHNEKGDPSGIRYIPAAGAVVSVRFPSIDASKDTTTVATSPYAGDRSIWSVAIADTDNFATGNLIVTVTEGGIAKRATIVNGVSVQPLDPTMC